MSDQEPFADPEAEEGESAAEQARTGVRVRLAVLFGRGDPVLTALVVATFFGRLGRGVFITVTVLYLTFIAGLSAGEVAAVVAATAIAGIGAAYAGGRLADRLSARRLLVVLIVVESAGLAAYVLVDGFVIALVVGVVTGAIEAAVHSVQAAVIARAFTGPDRVRVRAVLRTVTNVAIALGSSVAALPLVLGTPEAYRATILGAALASLASGLLLLRLPASVDASAFRGEGEPPRRRSPWRDARYLAFVGMASLFGIQFAVFEYGVPLWIAHDTAAPTVMVSVLLVLNTVIVTAFTVVLSRGVEHPARAGRVFGIAGVLMAVACAVYALAAGAPVWVAIGVLVLAGILHAFAEVLSQGAGWGLAFELADPVSIGEYQGLVGMGYSIVGAIGPPLIAITALQFGMPGWLALAALFLLTAGGVLVLGRRAGRTWVSA